MFASIIRRLNDIQLRKKLIFSFIFVVFIPVMIVGVYLTNEYRQMALNNAIEQTSINVERVKKRTEETLKVPKDISFRLLFDEQLGEVTNKRYDTTYEVVRTYRAFLNFKEYQQFYAEIANFRFYFDNPTMINNWQFIQPEEETLEADWYKAALDGKGKIGWYNIVDETTSPDSYLSLVRKIDFLEYHTSGVLVIDVNTNHLNAILGQETFETVIIDDNDCIVAANRPGLLGEKVSDTHLGEIIRPGNSGTFEAMVRGELSNVIIEDYYPDSSFNKLRIVSVFSIDSIVKEADRIRMLGFTVITVSFAIGLILIYTFSLLISNRVLKLSRHISRVAKGNLDAALTVDGKDEIGLLSRQFNSMVYSIKELMKEVHETNIQKNRLLQKQSEIKLKMMASQINPHFLFNALESIRMKAHIKGEVEISQIVKLLGKLMRKNLEVSGGKIVLTNEIEMIRCYLEIQKFRYEDRLNYNLIIDPLSDQVFVHPLIIQPLVENAVLHGLENKEGGGTVMVETRVLGDQLHVIVEDDGMGIPEDRLNEMIHSLNDAEDREGERLGLRNVHQRLQLSCGERYGLTIESNRGSGTRVHIRMPVWGEEDV